MLQKTFAKFDATSCLSAALGRRWDKEFVKILVWALQHSVSEGGLN